MATRMSKLVRRSYYRLWRRTASGSLLGAMLILSGLFGSAAWAYYCNSNDCLYYFDEAWNSHQSTCESTVNNLCATYCTSNSLSCEISGENCCYNSELAGGIACSSGDVICTS